MEGGDVFLGVQHKDREGGSFRTQLEKTEQPCLRKVGSRRGSGTQRTIAGSEGQGGKGDPSHAGRLESKS